MVLTKQQLTTLAAAAPLPVQHNVPVSAATADNNVPLSTTHNVLVTPLNLMTSHHVVAAMPQQLQLAAATASNSVVQQQQEATQQQQAVDQQQQQDSATTVINGVPVAVANAAGHQGMTIVQQASGSAQDREGQTVFPMYSYATSLAFPEQMYHSHLYMNQ